MEPHNRRKSDNDNANGLNDYNYEHGDDVVSSHPACRDHMDTISTLKTNKFWMKSNGLIFAAGVAIIVMMGNGINGKLDSINEKVGLYDGEHKVVIEKLRTLENNQKIIMDWKEQHTRDEISENHGTKYIETRRNNK
jgi:hypothetical protein